MFLSTLAGCCLAMASQEPSAVMQKSLAEDDVVARFAAARELALGDAAAEKWLLKEANKGTVQRQRALLFAAALMGTPSSFQLLEKAARKGRKADPQRAFALILYGSFHPQAGLTPKKDWARCASTFEQGCLLTGLLSRPQRLATDSWLALVKKTKEDSLQDILEMAQGLQGRKVPLQDTVSSVALHLLLAANPEFEPVTADWLKENSSKNFPKLWMFAAQHTPSRSLESLKRQALVGDRVGLVLALYEVEPKNRQPLFDYDRTRARGAVERAWLWGAAGDLGLNFPGPEEEDLADCRVAGILRLGVQKPEAARSVAQEYLAVARTRFQSTSPFCERWPAATLLALGGQVEDLSLLQHAFEKATGFERHRLTPIWKYANRSFGSEVLRVHWLNFWSRELGAGWRGYMDKQGPRWVAYFLTKTSLAAENHEALSTPYPQLGSVPQDYSLDHMLYRDLVEFLLGGDYRFGL